MNRLQVALRPCHKLVCEWKENTRDITCQGKWIDFWRELPPNPQWDLNRIEQGIYESWEAEASVVSTMVFSCSIKTAYELLKLALKFPSLSPVIVAGIMDRAIRPFTSIHHTDAIMSMLVDFILNMRFKVHSSVVMDIENRIRQKILIAASKHESLSLCAIVLFTLSAEAINETIDDMLAVPITLNNGTSMEKTFVETLQHQSPHWLFVMGCMAHGIVDTSTFLKLLQTIDNIELRSMVSLYIVVHQWQYLCNVGEKYICPELPSMPSALVAAYYHSCRGMPFSKVRTLLRKRLDSGSNEWESIPFASIGKYVETSKLINRPQALSIAQYERIAKNAHSDGEAKKEGVVKKARHSPSYALEIDEILHSIFKFVTAKRLCRLALVSKTFAKVSNSQNLWKRLYKTKWVDMCKHGTAYQHCWKSMYRDRVQVHAIVSLSRKTYYCCYHCGCSAYFRSHKSHVLHLKNHCVHECTVVDCGACFGTAVALKRHSRAHVVLKELK